MLLMSKTNLINVLIFRITINLTKPLRRLSERKKVLDTIWNFLNATEGLAQKLHKLEHKQQTIFLESDAFGMHVHCVTGPRLSCLIEQVDDKKISDLNYILNKILNFINTSSDIPIEELDVIYDCLFKFKSRINILGKFINEIEVAQLNERIKTTLSPMAIAFEAKVDQWDILLGLSKLRRAPHEIWLYGHQEFKEKAPWDLVLLSYHSINKFLPTVVKMLGGE